MKLSLALLVTGLALAAAQVPALDPCTGCVDDCINEIYVGFPECKTKMEELQSQYTGTAAEYADYTAAGYSDGKYCSFQSYLANMPSIGGAKGTIEHHCPDPNFNGVNEIMTKNADGSITFRVYRALQAYDEDGKPSYYGVRLLNANVANLPGVLGYLHVEVIPDDMKTEEDKNFKQRKYGIDNIMVFEVTVLNPQAIKDLSGSDFGRFSAMDRGVCGGADCNFAKLGGFAVGVQDQDNPRHGYIGGKWYSFPECGYCENPTGEPECTYTYKAVGMYHLDDLSFPVECPNCEAAPGVTSGSCFDGTQCSAYDPSIDTYPPQCNTGSTECDQDTISSWLTKKNTEHTPQFRAGDLPNIGGCGEPAKCTDGRSQSEAECSVSGGIWAEYGITLAGSDYWYYPCDERMCLERVLKLTTTPLDTVLAQPGSDTKPRYCVTGYTLDKQAKEWDHQSAHTVAVAANLLECATECNKDIDCVAFAWMDGSVVNAWKTPPPPCALPNFMDNNMCVSMKQCRLYLAIQAIFPATYSEWDGCPKSDGCVYERMTFDPYVIGTSSSSSTGNGNGTISTTGNGNGAGTISSTGNVGAGTGSQSVSGAFGVTPTGPMLGALFSAIAAAFVFA